MSPAAAPQRRPETGARTTSSNQRSNAEQARLFVAIQPPAEVCAAIARGWPEGFRRDEKTPPARWVPVANLHLTLAFLGAVARELIPELCQQLSSTALEAEKPPRLRLAGPLTFPPGRAARVLALRLEVLEGNLVAARRAVIAVVIAALGAAHPAATSLLAEERSRDFHPHLTLARANPPWPRQDVQRFTSRWAAVSTECPEIATAFTCEVATLFASEPGGVSGGAPRYHPLTHLPFARHAA